LNFRGSFLAIRIVAIAVFLFIACVVKENIFLLIRYLSFPRLGGNYDYVLCGLRGFFLVLLYREHAYVFERYPFFSINNKKFILLLFAVFLQNCTILSKLPGIYGKIILVLFSILANSVGLKLNGPANNLKGLIAICMYCKKNM
jgi:hypothetical protein